MHPKNQIANPTDNLLGTEIPDGWQIVEQLPRPGSVGAEDLTGSWFSAGYIAAKGNKKSFVKVIDIHRALQQQGASSLMERLKQVTDSHIFECAILSVCDKAKLDRVVQILQKGEIPPPAGAFPVALPYIMFELADGDVRKIISRSNKIDNAWRFQVLHDVAVGLQQLHSQKIAHQDLKPSNVLLFDQTKKGAKIGDLGRASMIGTNAAHDELAIPGAVVYAPPEQIFGIIPEKWHDRREACDLYHLGSLTTFMFSGTTPTTHYINSLNYDMRPKLWNGAGTCDYEAALPVLTSAFTEFVHSIIPDLPQWAEPELSKMIISSCDPNYMKRGDPSARQRVPSSIGIEVFVSRFDRLAKRALIEAKK